MKLKRKMSSAQSGGFTNYVMGSELRRDSMTNNTMEMTNNVNSRRESIMQTSTPTGEILWGMELKSFFSTEWSVVGVNYILKRGAFWGRRLIWLGLVLFGFGFMLFQIRERGSFYMSNPTQVDISLNYKNQIRFPTVTICSENLLDRNRSQYQYILPNGLEVLMNEIYPPWADAAFTPNFTVVQELAGILEQYNITWKFFWESLSPFQNKRHIIGCKFDGQPCSKDNFSLVTTDLGYCLQFNGKGFNYQSSRPGLSAGLILMANVRQIDFLYTKSIASGLRVLIHNKNSVPHVQNFGFRASTGFVTTASVRLKTITRLPLPYAKTNCSDDLHYDYNGCIDTCRHKRVIEACGCRYFYYSGSNITTCNPEQMYTCADVEIAEYPNNINTATKCGCLSQCSTDVHMYSLSQAVMADYAVEAMASSERNRICKNKTQCDVDLKDKETEIKRDWAQVEIYYSDLIHEEVITNKAYPLLQLLCDVGGAMGLILGSTVLSFFEIIDFFIVILYDWIIYRSTIARKKKNEKSFSTA